MIRLPFLLFFAAALFSAGVYGVLARRNGVLVLMSIELMLNAVTSTSSRSPHSCPTSSARSSRSS